jgi:monoamine oxidase
MFPPTWWHDQGLNGAAKIDAGTIRVTYDNPPADASFRALMCFIEAGAIDKLDSASEDEIEHQVRQSFVDLFGPRGETATDNNDGTWKNNPEEVQVHTCRLVV